MLLQTANILLGRDGKAKVADVGLAKILTREHTQVSMDGTFDWSAPEVGDELGNIKSGQGGSGLNLCQGEVLGEGPRVVNLPWSSDQSQPDVQGRNLRLERAQGRV